MMAQWPDLAFGVANDPDLDAAAAAAAALMAAVLERLLVPVDEEEGVLLDEDVDEDNGEAIAAFLSSVFAAFFTLSSVSLEGGEGDMVAEGKAWDQ